VNTTSSSAQNLMTCTIPAGALNSQYANLHIEVSGDLPPAFVHVRIRQLSSVPSPG
jgi:hypothetical protein